MTAAADRLVREANDLCRDHELDGRFEVDNAAVKFTIWLSSDALERWLRLARTGKIVETR